MAELVEGRVDVAFEDPLRGGPLGQCGEALLDGIGGGTRGPKPVGVRVGYGFRDRIQSQQIQGLHRAVQRRGNPQSSTAPFALGDIDAAQRLWMVAPLPERTDS